MAKIITAVLGVAFLVVLFLGQAHWNQQTAASEKNKPASPSNPASTAKSDKQTTATDNEQELLGLTSNWPATAIDRFTQTLKEKKPFKLLFVGSPALGSESEGAYPLIKEQLIDTFGANHLEVAIKTYNSTSPLFVKNNKQAEIAAEQADLIVMEPFILLNNGLVLMDVTQQNTTKIMNDIKTKNPETAFILQPSFPLYQAKIYPRQVDELKTYAEKNQLTYLDHWTSWPDPNSDEMKAYLLPDQSAPSTKGNQVWSESILQFLISNSESE